MPKVVRSTPTIVTLKVRSPLNFLLLSSEGTPDPALTSPSWDPISAELPKATAEAYGMHSDIVNLWIRLRIP